MKKALLLLASASFAVASYAQEHATSDVLDRSTAVPKQISQPRSQQKTTALGDTLHYRSPAQSAAGIRYYMDRVTPYDSGFVFGINALGYKAFAQLYNFSDLERVPGDTSVNIVGIASAWVGNITANSTKTVTFSVWPQGTAKGAQLGTKYFLYGLPTAAPVATATVNAKSLSLTGRTLAYFSTPAASVTKDMYVGYSINYTWSGIGQDTFGLQRIVVSQTSAPLPNYYTVDNASKDTLLAPNNIIQESNGTWKATVYQVSSNAADQIIYPMFRFNCGNCFPSGINGITRGNLTLLGTYPNPAINEINVKFGLKNQSNVNILIMDASGRAVATIEKQNLPAGDNVVTIPTSNLAAGNYMLALETANGSMAVQIIVAK